MSEAEKKARTTPAKVKGAEAKAVLRKAKVKSSARINFVRSIRGR